MGWINDVYSPWGYHEDFGWIYIFGNDPNNLWFYNQRNNDDWWTTADLWPYIYFYNEAGWFYNEPGTNWFVNLNTGQWVQK
jgi:hypothetical protein